MEKLQEQINSALVKFEQSGKIEQLIDQHVERTVKDAIADLFSYNGHIKNVIKSEVNKLVPVDAKYSVDLAPYNHVVCNLIKEKIGDRFNTEADRGVMKVLDSLFQTPPESITLQELMVLYLEAYSEDAHREGWEHPDIEFEDREDKNSFTLRLRPGYGEWVDSVYLHVYKGEILTLRLGDEESGKFFGNTLHGFEEKIFQLYAGRTKIEVGNFDPDDIPYYEWVD
ncbi:hypothetical protein [Halodesulfovibrio aestuarii]|uniref:Uncharacterized protein n=1 Tax=Halodesulfovibrio aestuarii TaxID=126333 RepID=A0ABV4JMU9_9BACT